MTFLGTAFRRRVGIALAAAACIVAASAAAHSPALSKSALAGVGDDARVSLQGRLSILDFTRGSGHERIYALVAPDGTATRLAFASNAESLRQGMAIAVTGRATRGALAVESHRVLGTRSIASTSATAVEGTLQLFHADYFEGGTTRFFWSLRQDDGQQRELALPIAPGDMESGMRVAVTGEADAATITPDSIAVLAAPTAVAPNAVAASNAATLVILLNFQPTPPAVAPSQPFTQAAVDAVAFSGASSVANYWSETSFGKQTLSGTVTPWLTASFQAPSTCDYAGIATEARKRAQAAGYNLANYQKFVYLFVRVAACGWAGLGEVPGTQTWSNQYNTLGVIGHEIGHTFGLGHANSLPCNGVTIATNCPTNRPEYGDPWDIMGNVSSRHVNAWQKNAMGWVPDAAVATHTVGSATYTLSPLETPGGSLYAVQIPAAYHRTYWVEYRTATGFDAGLPVAATNGAIVHLGGRMHQGDRSEYGCWDTCFLDMAPSTATMSDGALPVGSSFTDQLTGITINVLSVGAGGLTVSVASPPTMLDLGLYRALSPKTGLPQYQFLLDDGFDHVPDAKVSYGGIAGDIPLVGYLGTGDPLSSLVIYRNGMWNIDSTRDGVADKMVGFGGVAGDIPLVGDFNKDGRDDLVIYRHGTWFVSQFLTGSADKVFYFGGVPGDIPLVGDVDGDGVPDLVIYRGGKWFVSTARNGIANQIYYFGGMPQDVPMLFDWNGDGKADLCIFRDGLWFISTKRDGVADVMFGYGAKGDVPLTGKFY